jgi:hypothetical protein
MKRFLQSIAAILLAGLPVLALAQLPPEMVDLKPVKTKRMDQGYLLPGTDFSVYKKVMVDPAQVSFNKNWMKDMNRSGDLAKKISQEDMQKIAEAARSGFGEIFAETFKRAGIEVVSAPGPDVLRVTPAVINLYINAPSVGGSSATRTYAVQAGQASLVIALRDSVAGTLLGMALDKKETRTASAGPVLADGVTNRAEFEVLFRRWAETAVKGFNELRTGQAPQPKK